MKYKTILFIGDTGVNVCIIGIIFLCIGAFLIEKHRFMIIIGTALLAVGCIMCRYATNKMNDGD